MIKNPPLIKKAVEEMGGTIEKIIPERGVFLIKLKKEQILVSRKFQIARDFLSGNSLTSFKDLTYAVLKKNNLPMPKSVCFYRRTLHKTDIAEKLGQIKYPIVIKDAKGSNSKGVFTNIRRLSEARNIILREIANFSSLIAQEMVFGKEYRVLMLDKKAIGVLEMIPPRIFGDGKSTVRELIEAKQAGTAAKTKFDNFFHKLLEEQSTNLGAIIETGREVYIKKNSCLAEGGETKDATDFINPGIEKICAEATKAVGKYLSGIDLICSDISKNPEEQTINLLEINGTPDLYIHYNPTHGTTRNVIKPILAFILDLKKRS